MFDVVYLCFGAAAWALVAYKAVAWFRDRSNTDLGLACVMTGGVATVFLFSAPSLYRGFDHLVGVANLAMVFLYSSVMVFAAGALVLLLRWTAGDGGAARAGARTRARRTVGAVALLWAVAVTGFAVGRPDAVEHPRDFSTAYTDAPGVMVFLVLYLAIFGASLAGLGTLCPRYAARLGPSWLARGLRVLAAGCWLGLVYCACKVIGFSLSWTGHPAHWLSNGVAPLSASVAALLVLTGFSLPAAGPRVAAWRRLRRLTPLWRTVTAQTPEVTMDGSRWSGRWPFADLEWRANRQMAEIRDVQRGIRRHVESDAVDIVLERARAVSLDDRQLAAVAEAAALRRGLENRAVGHVPVHGADSVVVATAHHRPELAAEYEHLALVADVYRSPLIETVLVELRQRSATPRR
ncbi:MAB_1171c family putative transporter [Streptomyces sp. WZ-12]|uniref:MAB_1171c family putative transporter n=1 Tax=Streptomyces sp. WZ-12 TaxID=3030210 RepID=UPI002380C966|nr:MAB_1171c family putative transporter [Streptomyces sp. WZ-12]